jgi:phosphoribosyl-AMP cyclohydrolase
MKNQTGVVLMLLPNFEKQGGLIPTITQDYKTGDILMLAYMNQLSFEKTLATGKVHYWSRSRNKLWLKGEESGHFQILKEIYLDCDEDTILVKVEQVGDIACHTGNRSCFYRKYNPLTKDFEV